MKRKLALLAFVTVSIFFPACSAPEFFTFKPDSDKVETENGSEIAFIEDEFLFSNIEFEDAAEGNFIFYFFVLNKSDEPILIDPSQIKMIAFDENKTPLLTNNKSYAIDPDAMIAELEEDIENREVEHGISTGLNFIFALVSTAADLSNDNDNDAAEVIENVAVFAGNQANEEIDYSNDVGYLESQKKLWENEVLPNIILDSDEDIGGLVFIPELREAAYIKVIIPFENKKHTYFFKKEIISVR